LLAARQAPTTWAILPSPKVWFKNSLPIPFLKMFALCFLPLVSYFQILHLGPWFIFELIFTFDDR
jgi:hypothetical protein